MTPPNPPKAPTFDYALDFVLRHEGGYVNDPDDPGGATNYGITQSTYESYLWRDVRHITQEEVRDIYESRYWHDGRCDAIHAVAPRVAMAHLDACVNTGIIQAARFLQRAVGVAADGHVGPVTLRAIEARLEPDILGSMLLHRERFYHDLVSKRPALKKFLKGWLLRLSHLRTALGL